MAEVERFFPWLAGLGSSIGASLPFLLPSEVRYEFPLAAVLLICAGGLAVLFSTLRIRNGRGIWLGRWHLGAALAAVTLGYVFANLAYVSFLRKGAEGPDAVALIILLIGALSGWFAFGFQRWAEDHGRVDSGGNGPRERRIGAAGLVGGTIVALSATVVGGLTVSRSSYPPYGPMVFEWLLALTATACLTVLGLAGLALQAHHIGARVQSRPKSGDRD